MALIIGLGTIPAYAQYGYDSHRFEISPFVGYQFGGKLSVRSGTLSINDAMNYGAALDFYIRPGVQLELAYHPPIYRTLAKGCSKWTKITSF